MRRTLLAAWLVSLIAPPIAAAAPQQRDAALAVPPSGRITGAVAGAESGRPVRFAKVVLTSNAGEVEVITDESGGFTFDKLAAGAYTLRVSKPGYLDMTYGQTRPGTNTAGKTIRLRDREQIDRIVVPLSHGGSISGVVRDERGEPAYRARVRALRWATRNGVRVLDEVASVEADERGLYRFSMLPSRNYLISAAQADDAVPENKSGRPAVGFAPMFYPGTATADGAAVIALGAGAERPNVDFQLPLVPLARVTGVVHDADGKPVAGIPVSLIDATGSHAYDEQGTETKADGRFAFDRVVPGAYAVNVGRGRSLHTFEFSGKLMRQFYSVSNVSYEIVKFEREVTKELATVVGHVSKIGGEVVPDAPATLASAPLGTASADISATSGAVTDLVLVLERPREVSGRVLFDGASARPPIAGMEITLLPAGVSGEMREAKLKADGTFVVPNVAPGKYAVALDGADPWSLASAVSAGVETLDARLDVPRDRDVRDLTVTMRDRGTELSGVVTDPAAQPVGDRIVMAFAADERLWSAGTHRIRTQPLSADGQFSFGRLPPGSYRLAVVDGAEPDEWLDPEFLRQIVAGSILVTLGEGEHKVQNVRIGRRPAP